MHFKIYIILSILMCSGCTKHTINHNKTASIADIHDSITNEMKDSKDVELIYLAPQSILNDSSVHIFFGFLSDHQLYLFRTISFDGDSYIYRVRSNEEIYRYWSRHLYPEEMTRLNKTFFKYNFHSYREYLPYPQDENPQEPGSYFIIGFREKPSKIMKKAMVDMSIGGGFPETFFNLLYELNYNIYK